VPTNFRTADGLVKAVDDVSFDLREGEILGLVGESGCGKGVSALFIFRLLPDPSGKIVGGQVLFEGLSPSIMPRIKGNLYLTSDPILFPNFFLKGLLLQGLGFFPSLRQKRRDIQ
jgi:ABC-type dipeptide/oligopeptide/nickel transport system ATPase component